MFNFMIYYIIIYYNTMSEEDKEFDVISDKKDALLEKNNLGDFKIKILINPVENNTTIFDIIKNKQLFELLYELNKGIIKDLNIKNIDNIDNLSFIFIDVINEEGILDKDEEIFIKLNLKTNFIADNNYEIIGLNIENNSNIDRDTIILDNFILKIEKTDNIILNISFSILNDESPEFIKTFVALYLQKIFYNLKLYFE